MADYKTRIFTKEVAGETKTREVTSPQAEVAALFDGFAEKTSAKSTGTTSRPASSSS